MDILYLGNSGWRVSNGRQLLVFDDISGGRFNDAEAQRGAESIVIFASHVHGDHFSQRIFAQYGAFENANFVLSGDIRAREKSDWPLERIHYLDEGDDTQIDGIEVRAFGSTDEGVSFDLRLPASSDSGAERLRLFHAGDLNDWHWELEGDAAWTAKQAAWFTRILAEIPKQPRMDLAFFPVDPRMGLDYYRGALQFAREFAPRIFVPMHFGAQFDPPEAFARAIAPLVGRVLAANQPGQHIELR